MCMVSLSSCIYDAPDAPLVSEEEMLEELNDFKVALRFETEIPVGTTRAPGDGTYDDGTTVPYENFVDIENRDFRILFFNEANEYITTLDKITYVAALDGTTSSKHYQVMGRLKDPLPENFKVVIVANWGNYNDNLMPGSTFTIADYCTSAMARYTYTPGFTPTAATPIPMYGVKAFTAKNLIPFEVNDLGTIHLLRAMAKVEVNCAYVGWTIESVCLNRYNTMGYCAPSRVFSETDYVTGSYATDYVDHVSIPGESQIGENLYFKPTATGSYMVYIPEYQNIVKDAGGNNVLSATPAQLIVKFKELPLDAFNIDFKYYNPPAGYAQNEPFDIKRNNYYNFTIRKSGVLPAIVVDVRPYDHVELDPVFGQ